MASDKPTFVWDYSKKVRIRLSTISQLIIAESNRHPAKCVYAYIGRGENAERVILKEYPYESTTQLSQEKAVEEARGFIESITS